MRKINNNNNDYIKNHNYDIDNLRDYQTKFINNIANSYKWNHKAVCGVMPCGAGKTVVMAWIIKHANLKGNTVLFIVHRKELISQAAHTFKNYGIDFSVINKSKNQIDLNHKTILCSVQTLSLNLKLIPKNMIKMIIIDECHHAKSNQYMKVLKNYPKASILGLTATPARLDGSCLGDIFDDLIVGVNAKKLISNHFLTEYDYYMPKSKINFNNIRTAYGDFVKSDIDEECNKPQIIGDIISNYIKYANGRNAILYAASVNQSLNIVEQFKAQGYSAAHIDAKTNEKEREKLVDDFRKGKINILSNVDLFGEGFDVPCCDCVILCRPTLSLTLFIQQSMRCMRIDNNNKNKKGIIIDHVANVTRFGLPDRTREWTLDPQIAKKIKQRESKEVKSRTCEKCHTVFISKNNSTKCPKCGFINKLTGKEIEQIEGELIKIQEIQTKENKKSELKQCHTKTALEDYARKYHYKYAWVYVQCKLRNISMH